MMYDVHEKARKLAELDAAMRKEQGHRAAVAARFRFYEAAIRGYAIRRLNSLGELVPSSRLSERSLDVAFEDSRYSDDVVAEIVRAADRDVAFADLIVEQEGASYLSYLRGQVGRDLFGHPIAAAA